MGGQARFSSRLQLAIAFVSVFWLTVQAHYVPYLDQSFFFSWDPPGPLQIPVTEQCQVINITWQRAPATGPNPVPPYFLQVYSSAYPFPFVIPAGYDLAFSWPVPFAPNTRYQICMFDINGNTGGCQAIYTMIPSRSVNATTTPTCANVTYPDVTLGVVGTVQSTSPNGTVLSGQPWSTYGWIDQCTDISVLPKNGTPPYTLTVAVSSHPPYNITVNSVEALNWTVGLTWASSFFVSVFDAVGHTWASGPLHAGGGGSTGCLSQNSTSSGTSSSNGSKNQPPAVSIGAGIGGLALGILVGSLSAYCIMRRNRQKQQAEFDRSRLMKASTQGSSHGQEFDRPMSGTSSNTRPTLSYADDISNSLNASSSNPRANRTGRSAPTHYQVEPLVLPGEGGHAHHPIPSAPETVASHSHPSEADYHPQERSHVYVVHHDGGRPPVTVYTGSGAEVVELPPTYPMDASRQTGPRPNPTQRRPAASPIPRKVLLSETQKFTKDPPT